MNAQNISDALEFLDDALLDEANALRGSSQRRKGWLKWAGTAACLAAVLAGGFALYGQLSSPSTADLPVLDITPKEDASAFGFEGYLAYDISELVSANPWTEQTDLKTLPVFRNPLDYDRAGAPVSPVSVEVMEAMKARLLETARRLGLENIQVTDNAPSREEIDAVTEKFASVGEEVPDGYFEPTEVTAESGGVKLAVGADLAVQIEFHPAAALPEGYNFMNYDASYEDTRAVGEYLLEQYRDLLGMEEPQLSVPGGDYTFAGQQLFGSVEFFDAAGDKVQQILNYNFNTARFSCNDAGELWLVRLDRPDLSLKMGDYPIISTEDARELLCAGHYITTVPEAFPGEAHIAKVELVYRDSRRDEYLMPYYRFYVEVPDMARDNGLKTFGAYYVPAVSGEFLTGLPVWDGSFN